MNPIASIIFGAEVLKSLPLKPEKNAYYLYSTLFSYFWLV